MVRANVAELKANLSHYLRIVQNGEDVVVCARNRPVARLVGLAGYETSERDRAAAAGLLEVREGACGALALPKPTCQGDAVRSVVSGREER